MRAAALQTQIQELKDCGRDQKEVNADEKVRVLTRFLKAVNMEIDEVEESFWRV